MSYQLIAQGGVLDAAEISNYENYIAEGQRAQIQLDLSSAISNDIGWQLLNELKQQGVADASVTVGNKLVTIGWRKGFPWLAVIVAIVLALIVLAILIIGWRIYKEVGPAAGNAFFTGAGFLIAALIVGAGAIYLINRRR